LSDGQKKAGKMGLLQPLGWTGYLLEIYICKKNPTVRFFRRAFNS